jgi:hypothetical protein
MILVYYSLSFELASLYQVNHKNSNISCLSYLILILIDIKSFIKVYLILLFFIYNQLRYYIHQTQLHSLQNLSILNFVPFNSFL